ncbi:hypothetical protein Tco_0445837 [Tanacetum coccineum]
MPIPPTALEPYISQIRVVCHGISIGDDFDDKNECMLKEHIGAPPNLCIISDIHPAIILACCTVFDNSVHGYCDRHLMINCNLKGKKLQGIFWKACKAYTRQDFDKEISKLRGYSPKVVNKVEEAGTENWVRAYFPASHYNYMTSNSVESINSLTRIVQRVPITMLVEYCRDLLQRWYCEKRHKYQEAPDHELTGWAGAKVHDRMLKSTNWCVKGIDHLKLYQVSNNKESHHVDLVNFECTYRKCLWGKPWFMKTTLKSTYQEMVYPLKDPSMWQAPNDLQFVLLPVINKRPAGRPKNTNQILSTNESRSLPSCTRCGMNGHNRNACNQPFPRTDDYLTEDGRLDEERMRNGWIYMD